MGSALLPPTSRCIGEVCPMKIVKDLKVKQANFANTELCEVEKLFAAKFLPDYFVNP